MRQQRTDWWSLGYLLILALGVVASGYHLYGGRYPNFLMAAGAVVLGAIVYIAERQGRLRHAQTTTVAPEQRGPRMAAAPAWLREDRDREQDTTMTRVTSGILAGFAAAIVMALALFPSYLVAAVAADQHGYLVGRWFYGLAHNSLTDSIFNIPIGAISVNLLAGIAWALVYTLLVEPRLSGPGWRRGLVFSIAPWLLSLVVFFPLVGAGFFGASLHAGPLPALGNLILHLLYGATLGAVYCLPEVNPAEEREGDAQMRQWENEGIAFGLLGGLAVGLVVGAALSTVIANSQVSFSNLLLVCGALGCAIGGALGPFVGVGYGGRHMAR
jgi:uncharacterized protein DUF6789